MIYDAAFETRLHFDENLSFLTCSHPLPPLFPFKASNLSASPPFIIIYVSFHFISVVMTTMPQRRRKPRPLLSLSGSRVAWQEAKRPRRAASVRPKQGYVGKLWVGLWSPWSSKGAHFFNLFNSFDLMGCENLTPKAPFNIFGTKNFYFHPCPFFESFLGFVFLY